MNAAFDSSPCEGEKVTESESLDVARVPAMGPLGPTSDTVPGRTEFPQHVRFKYACKVWDATCSDAEKGALPSALVIAVCVDAIVVPLRRGSANRIMIALFTKTLVEPSFGVTCETIGGTRFGFRGLRPIW